MLISTKLEKILDFNLLLTLQNKSLDRVRAIRESPLLANNNQQS